MEEMMGKWGADLYRKARGESDAPVSEEHETKSIGEQTTFSEDTKNPIYISEQFTSLCKDVIRRMKGEGFTQFRTVVITVRFADFQTKTRTYTLSKPVSDEKTLCFEAARLFMPFLDTRENPRKKLIRLIGVRIEKLT